MQDLDTLSRQHLRRVQYKADYLKRGDTGTPTRDVFQEAGVTVSSVQTYDFEGESAVVVFQFPAERNPLLDEGYKAALEGGESTFHYAVNWPREQDNGKYYNETFIFASLPTENDIKEAARTHEISHKLRWGEYNESYTCRVCSKRVHWTDTGKDEDIKPVLKQQMRLLEHEVCCEDHILEKGEHEQEEKEGVSGGGDSVAGKAGSPIRKHSQ
jgi:hypothetical protein